MLVWSGLKENNVKDKQMKPMRKFRTTVMWELEINTAIAKSKVLSKPERMGILEMYVQSNSLHVPEETTQQLRINKLFGIGYLSGCLWIIF